MAVAAVQPSRRHTARKTLSVLRSGAPPASNDFVSTDFTDISAAVVLVLPSVASWKSRREP
jgi:hypothetical protein